MSFFNSIIFVLNKIDVIRLYKILLVRDENENFQIFDKTQFCVNITMKQLNNY